MIIITQKNFAGGNERSTEYQVFGEEGNSQMPNISTRASVSRKNHGSVKANNNSTTPQVKVEKLPKSTDSSENNFLPELDPHKQVFDFLKKGYEKAQAERDMDEAIRPKKSHEITAVGAVNPQDKEKMLIKNEVSKMSSPDSDYFKDYFQKAKSQNEKTQKVVNNTSEEKSPLPTEPVKTQEEVVPLEKPKITSPVVTTPVKQDNTVQAVEETTTPPVEKTSVEQGKISNSAKAGLAVAGATALAAGGYAAYKAWKKKKAKKAAVNAEVNEFLNNKFKTEK